MNSTTAASLKSPFSVYVHWRVQVFHITIVNYILGHNFLRCHNHACITIIFKINSEKYSSFSRYMWKTLCHSAQRREQHLSEGTGSKEKHIFESGETLSFNVCEKMPKLKNFSTHCCKVISVDHSQASKCIWGYVFSQWLFEYVHRAQHNRTEVDLCLWSALRGF